MTLQQAIKEGKFFKRPKHDDWQTVNDKGIVVWASRAASRKNGDPEVFFTAESLLADDWIASNGPIEPVTPEVRNVVQLRR